MKIICSVVSVCGAGGRGEKEGKEEEDNKEQTKMEREKQLNNALTVTRSE